MLSLGCQTTAEPVVNEPATDTDSQITFFREKIAKSDKHYPSYALLADALFRKARETGDPAYLAEARRNIDASMAIQPNYIAMKTMAMISNYSHRFADAIAWAEKAASASAEGLEQDSEVTAIFVEAYLGLGENVKAERVLHNFTNVGKKPDDFYIASARGGLLKAQNNVVEAVKAFETAERFAAKQNAKELVAWCIAMEAGCFLDSGRAAEAQAYLEKGKAMAPGNKLLQIHSAEFLAASDRPEDALKIYEVLLKASDDPEMHHRAYVLTRDLGRTEAANSHFADAERGFQKILDAGEIYTLGSLAQLYCEQGTDLEKARSLALRNLEYKRDHEAQQTFRCVVRKMIN